MRKSDGVILILALVLAAGCAGIRAKKEQKSKAESWIQKAESAIQSAVSAGANDRRIRDARFSLKSAKDFFRDKKYHAAGMAAQSANSTARQAIDEEREARIRQEEEEEEARRKAMEKSKPAPRKRPSGRTPR